MFDQQKLKTMGQKYVINENGEIIRGDYFFTNVKDQKPQPLNCSRSAWVMFLLNIVTLGIYGTVITFAMGKESNITCENDGKHTKGFWPTLGLSIVTLGIYAIVWVICWMKRESDFLKARKEPVIITGGGYVLLAIINVILQSVITAATQSTILSLVVGWLISFLLMALVIKKHNRVNEIYNLEQFPQNIKEAKK